MSLSIFNTSDMMITEVYEEINSKLREKGFKLDQAKVRYRSKSEKVIKIIQSNSTHRINDLAASSGDIIIYTNTENEIILPELLEYTFVFSKNSLKSEQCDGYYPLVIYYFGIEKEIVTKIISQYLPRPFACIYLNPETRPALQAFRPYNLIQDSEITFSNALENIKSEYGKKFEDITRTLLNHKKLITRLEERHGNTDMKIEFIHNKLVNSIDTLKQEFEEEFLLKLDTLKEDLREIGRSIVEEVQGIVRNSKTNEDII